MKKKKQEAKKKRGKPSVEVSRETLTNALRKCARRLGRRPTIPELKAETGYRVSAYLKSFGSWSASLKAAGFRAHDRRQMYPDRYPSRERLADVLRSLAKRLGRRPQLADLTKEEVYGVQEYLRAFGKWRKALEYAGLLAYPRIPEREARAMKKKLEDAFKALRSRLGRTPYSHELDRGGKYNYRLYVKYFGSYRDFLKTQNLRPVDSRLTREELDANYDMVKKRLGRLPRTTELDRYGKYSTQTYREHFGSVRRYRMLRGEDLLPTREIPMKQVMADYKKVRDKMGRVPKLSELVEGVGYNIQYLVDTRFGSYSKFLKKIGQDSARIEDWVSAAVGQYWRVKKQLGKVPSEDEYGKNGKFYNGTLRKHFGSWNNFLRFLGEPLHTGGKPPTKKRKHPSVDHLLHLRTAGYRK